MAEATIVNAILKAYRARGAFAVKIHGSPVQPRIIDILACYKRYFIGLEVKQPGKKATRRQAYVLDQINNASGWALTVHSVPEALIPLDSIDAVQEREKTWLRADYQSGTSGLVKPNG